MKIIKSIILIVLAFSLLFLVACEEGKTTDGSGTTETKETTVKTETSEGSTTLAGLLSKKTLEYKAKYNLESTYNGEQTKSTMTWAIKGNDKMKWEIVNPNQEGSGSFYFLSNAMYVCTNQNGKQGCIKMASPDNKMNLEENLKAVSDENKYSTSLTTPKTVAGAVAFCFNIVAKGNMPGFVSSEYCVSKEGIPLYIKSVTDEGSSVMEAVEYSTSVADSEFVLPAEAQDINALMQQYNTGSA